MCVCMYLYVNIYSFDFLGQLDNSLGTLFMTGKLFSDRHVKKLSFY